MSTFETCAARATLRRLAREQLAGLDNTLRELASMLPIGERLELSLPLLDLRRLLHGGEAPVAQLLPPANLFVLRAPLPYRDLLEIPREHK